MWFRQDLRLADNPALSAAVATGRPVIPILVLDDVTPGRWRRGGASRWWLHHSLVALGRSLAEIGSSLVLRQGDAAQVIRGLVSSTGAAAVYWNRCYEPSAVARDTGLKAALKADGIDVQSFNAALLFEPWEIRNGSGEPFKVFSPFWRACLKAAAPHALFGTPVSVPAPATFPPSEELNSWSLLPAAPDWAGGLRATWTPGEQGARKRLSAFLANAINGYADERNNPDKESTSRLSPHLHFGEIGPRQVWHAARSAESAGASPRAIEKFLSEIGWREFSYHLLHQFPALPDVPFRPEFASFPWKNDARALAAWQRGRTGYPIVDAGMRELWQTGWMHNRVRMITASFLVKHLLQPWQDGEAWFWDTLVDADLANNAASWQWVTGSGADAAPYFRIFNPVLQGQKFDPEGRYVRRFVPEIAKLPDTYIHCPWEAPEGVLAQSGVELGRTYPRPMVDLGSARDAALRAFETVKRAAA